MAMPRLAKQQLLGKLTKKTWTFDEKIKFLDFAKKNPKLGCRKLANIYKNGKTTAANILKNEKKIPEQHEMLREKSKKCNLHGKYQKKNEILFEWCKKCCAFNIYQIGVMVKEEPMVLQNLGWLARLLENNIFHKRTSYYRDSYFLDGEDKQIDWRLLAEKHLEYGRI